MSQKNENLQETEKKESSQKKENKMPPLPPKSIFEQKPQELKEAPKLPDFSKKVEKSQTKKFIIEEKKEVLTMKSLSIYNPLKDIFKMRNWNSIKHYSQSERGSAGVFFCLTETDEIVVIKAGSAVGEELFASELAFLLEVYAPRMRLIEWSPPSFPRPDYREWDDLKKRMETLGGFKVNKELNRAFFLVMEFIPNIGDLTQVDSKTFTEEVLRDIGRLVILDVLLNNWDRFPTGVLWDHQGNPFNLLFNIKEKRCAAIDQSITVITKDDIYKKYLENVKLFTQKVVKGEGDPVETIIKTIKFHSGVEIPKENEKYIWEGLNETLKKVINISKDDLTNLKKKVEKMKKGSDWGDVWRDMMGNISIEFMDSIIKSMKEALN